VIRVRNRVRLRVTVRNGVSIRLMFWLGFVLESSGCSVNIITVMSKLSETPELHVSRNIFATLAKTNY